MSDRGLIDSCPECQCDTIVVYDYRAGDVVCSKCGLILEQRFIDDRSDRHIAFWESSSDSDDEEDTTAQDGLVEPLSDDALASLIDDMADRLGLVTIIKDRAKEIYKMLADHKLTKNKNQDPTVAACLYMACRQERLTRSFKGWRRKSIIRKAHGTLHSDRYFLYLCLKIEMTAAASGLRVRDVSRAVTCVQKHLREHTGTTMEPDGSIHPAIFVKRFCAPLGLNPSTVKKIHEVVQKCEEIDIRRSPTSIAAAAIYMITKQSDEKPIGDIAAATGVGKSTIRNVAKEIEAKIS